MMTDVFLKLLNMSIAASWVVLAAVVFRALFRKAPRWISLVMWGTVALRLVIPFSVESPLSMIPTTESFGTAGAYPSQIVFRTGIEVLNSASGFVSEESNPSGTFAPGAYTPLSGGKEVITDSSDSPAQDQNRSLHTMLHMPANSICSKGTKTGVRPPHMTEHHRMRKLHTSRRSVPPPPCGSAECAP